MTAERAVAKATLPRIAVLGTGGTIAGAGNTRTHYAGYRAAVAGVDELLSAVPMLSEVACIETEQVAQVASQNLGAAVLLTLATRVNAWLERPECDGAVVTLGTNTLEETAYFLNLVVKSRKPVVVTGAMRPFTSLSADGPMNLYRAVVAAASPQAEGLGVVVVMNDQVIAARDVHKTDTMTVDSFKAPVFGILGWVVDDKLQLYKKPARCHTADTEFRVPALQNWPRVDIITGHQDDQRTALDAVVGAGARGVVVAGPGTAALSDRLMAAARDAARQGVVIVRAPRAAHGIVLRNMEFDDDLHGTVAGDTLSPAKARVLLSLALAHGADAQRVQAAFSRY
jgi:L-asparaginase type II